MGDTRGLRAATLGTVTPPQACGGWRMATQLPRRGIYLPRMRTAHGDRLNVVYRAVAAAVDPGDVAVSFTRRRHAAVLESVCDTAGYGRFSILVAEPVSRLSVAVDDVAGIEAAFARMNAVACFDPAPDALGLPFIAGWVGWIPYEAGAALDGIIRASTDGAAPPRLEFALYDAALVHDRARGRWHVAAVDLPQSRHSARDRAEVLARWLVESSGSAGSIATTSIEPLAEPEPTVRRADYLAAVRRAIEYIAAGDIYQVNLTQRFTTRTTMSPGELYRRLRRANPADFAALLPWGENAVVSASPELFLRVDAEGCVLTRPIKGTRPRGGTPSEDAAARAALLASAKDRAELNMIIDLLRNDLGRVCAFGSVRVVADADIEVHPTVVHLVGTIEGRLRPEVTIAELLRATFPGGSITGCPKIRAMQIIRELEPTPRGAYCGAIGFVGLDGQLGLSVAIRTMQCAGQDLHIHAGGAITADSDPAAEYAETLAKAEGMFRALGHTTAGLDGACVVN